MKKYPLQLSCVEKSAIWGGSRLVTEFGKPELCRPLAETWELSVREKENCTVKNGPLAGKTLAEALSLLGNDSMGTKAQGKRFPLLVKLIDAADELSVQVHPDDAYAARDGESGKTEMWHILAAAPGAGIYYGLESGVTKQMLRAALRRGDPTPLLRRIPVHAGETYFIPAGLVHAIGKGVLVAEVQQNCDLTYRVFDHNRLGADGKPRQLHIEKALDVIRPFCDAEIEQLRYAAGDRSALVSCPYFTVHRMDLTDPFHGLVGDESFLHLLFVDGAGELMHDGVSYHFAKGDSFYLPAGLGEYTLIGGGAVLGSVCAKTI